MELESNATKCTECNLTGKSYFFDGTVPPPRIPRIEGGVEAFFLQLSLGI